MEKTRTADDAPMDLHELTDDIESYRPVWQPYGIGADDESMRSAAAVGLVEMWWRNGPIEDAHGDLNGPTDGHMTAESIALHHLATKTLAGPLPDSLYTFEEHLLDRDRTWTGTDTAVRHLVRDTIVEQRKSIKQDGKMIRALLDVFGQETWELTLINEAIDRYYGLPTWPERIHRFMELLSAPDDEHWQKSMLCQNA